jgi:hypothetical protein
MLPRRRYYNPIDDLTSGRAGRTLSDPNFSGNHNAAKMASGGDHLYALLDRGSLAPSNAVCVDDRELWDHLWQRHLDGDSITFTVYALTEEEHARAQ